MPGKMLKSEFEEIVYFTKNGRRKDGMRVTDDWIQSSLEKCVNDLILLKEALHYSISTGNEWSGTVRRAREIIKDQKKNAHLDKVFENAIQVLTSVKED